MPYRIRTEPSDEIVLLNQIIASVGSQLDGFAGDDPAALPLREHLDELTTRRDQLLRTEEDSAYARNRQGIWLFLFLSAGGIAMASAGLAGLAGAGRNPVLENAVLLAVGAFLMMMSITFTVGMWSDIREYRKRHSGESS